MSRNRIIEGCYLTINGQERGSVKLTPDKALFPGHFIPPIKWIGNVNKHDVEIIQISISAHSQSDFKFIKYPEEFDDLKDEIIKGIDDAMRVMD